MGRSARILGAIFLSLLIGLIAFVPQGTSSIDPSFSLVDECHYSHVSVVWQEAETSRIDTIRDCTFVWITTTSEDGQMALVETVYSTCGIATALIRVWMAQPAEVVETLNPMRYYPFCQKAPTQDLGGLVDGFTHEEYGLTFEYQIFWSPSI